MFGAKCGSCHGIDHPSAGLTLITYGGALQGATAGPVILPRNSAQSELVLVQMDEHFANLTAQELDAVKKWIDAGALEKQ